VVLNVFDGGDSIYLASTGDDCGMRGGIYYNGQDWQYYRDQFTVNTSDPLDIALKVGVVMERIVGVDEEAARMKLKIYPNPSSGKIRIDLPNTDFPARIHLRTSEGRIIRGIPEYISGTLLKLDALSPGLYLIEVYQNGRSGLERLIISQ
jgi:hypothetical protein